MAKKEEVLVRVTNARLSFHSLDTHEEYEGVDTGKFSATLLVSKDGGNPDLIEEGIEAAIIDKWGKNRPPTNKIKTTYRDGDDEKYDGYANNMALKGTNKRPIHVINRDRTPIMIDDDFDTNMYNGCYVNASVSFNAGRDQKKNYRVWCNLRAVQFYKHGEKFGGGTPVNIDEEFEEFDDLDDGDVPEDMLA